MIPHVFAKLHDKYKTPINALLLIGLLSIIAPFFGKKMLVWVVDAGNFGCCVAYCMVAISFVILRKKAPEMPVPTRSAIINWSAPWPSSCRASWSSCT